MGHDRFFFTFDGISSIYYSVLQYLLQVLGKTHPKGAKFQNWNFFFFLQDASLYKLPVFIKKLFL
jgi:hypothetical protein